MIKEQKMTRAGDRIMHRETTATHVATGKTVIVTNAGIPLDQYQPCHMEQRDRAIALLSGKVGNTVARNECVFEFNIIGGEK